MEGYAWLPNRRRRSRGKPVRSRLTGKNTVALHGPKAVRFFFDESHVERHGTLPGPLHDTLFGRGAVHTPDGQAHHSRKALFRSLVKDRGGLASLADHLAAEWDFACQRWAERERVVLFAPSRLLLTRAICAWSGLWLTDREAEETAGDLVAMIDGFASAGPRHLRARRARSRQEDRLAGRVAGIRDGSQAAAAGSVLEAVAPYRTPLADGDAAYARAFAHEIRRFYPFAPFVGGLAAADLRWGGQNIPAGSMVLLDLYGQNHDPELWPDPCAFDPRRFLGREPGRDELVPQGGGDPAANHRCPGDDVTLTVLGTLVPRLAALDYDVPAQDLGIPLGRIPTASRSGFLMTTLR
ncbi:cytochrome P450 [Streptomyces rubiginosohelvolus]